MDAAERLLAVEEIKQLKARYFRCMDTKDWDGYAAVYAADAVLDVSGESGVPDGEGVIRGGTAIAEYVKGQVDPVTTVHHGHMPEIEITSPTTATGIWSMEDMLRWPEDAPIDWMHGYGHYHETYEKVDGEWRIKSCRLTRLRVDFGMR
ncbi:MAG TPA: nuclear transport factor 2 family protein [Acidimicrobiia bacterium]|nr:nuclear transport factor 2 family protein [Acidimicrobiia bacterium]